MRRTEPPATVTALLARLAAPAALATLLLAACSSPAPTRPADTTSATPGAAGAADRIPADFPLTSGWKPGLEAPRRTDADLPACGDPSSTPPATAGTDRLVATWSGRHRTRQLTLHADPEKAREEVRALLDHYEDCRRTGSGEAAGQARTWVRAVPGGAGSPPRWEVRLQTTPDDGLEGAVVQVVQVGRAVLVDVAGVPERARPWRGVARSLAEDQLTWSAGVLSAMDDL